MPPEKPIEEYARKAVSRAVEYELLMRRVKHESKDEGAMSLLAESLSKKSNQ
jgi:hypothetical protein